MKNLNLFVITILFICSNTLMAQNKSDDILGIYLNPNESTKIKIYKEDNHYSGKIIWLTEPLDKKGNPKLDINNSNKELRDRPLIGLVTLTGLQYIDEDWTDGKMYNHERGKTVNFKVVSITKQSMKIKVTLGFFSKEIELARVEE